MIYEDDDYWIPSGILAPLKKEEQDLLQYKINIILKKKVVYPPDIQFLVKIIKDLQEKITILSKEGFQKSYRNVVKKALGKPIPKGAVVHHINGDHADNRNFNLVLCENTEYHHLLHIRMKAYNKTGHPNYRVCAVCKKYDNPNIMRKITNSYVGKYQHVGCS